MKTYGHTKTYTQMFGAHILNGQKVGLSQISTNWWTDKQNVVYPQKGVLFNYEKEVLIHATI